jgi:hypothetical protein
MPDSSRIADKITPWINDSIAAHGKGEEVAFEVAMALAPDGMPVVFIAFWMQSGVVGSSIPLTVTVNNPMALAQVEVDRMVAGTIEQILQRRSVFLEQQQRAAQAQADAQNGHHDAPPQGLVLPGALPPV